jgi:group I intron endonuclease
MNVGIYKVENLKTNKVYIGGSINIERRKSEHFSNLKFNNHGNRNLQKDYNKYGKDNFKFIPLLICSEKDLLFYEQRAIDIYKKNLYNVCLIAGTSLGYKHSKKTLLKMSDRSISEETRKKISEANKGKKHSERHKEKISIRMKGNKYALGNKLSIETRKKMSEAHDCEKKAIKVYNYKTKEFVCSYPSTSECSKDLNLNKGSIVHVLKGRCNHHKGYYFKYLDKDIK